MGERGLWRCCRVGREPSCLIYPPILMQNRPELVGVWRREKRRKVSPVRLESLISPRTQTHKRCKQTSGLLWNLDCPHCEWHNKPVHPTELCCISILLLCRFFSTIKHHFLLMSIFQKSGMEQNPFSGDSLLSLTDIPIPKPRMYFKTNSSKLDSKPTKHWTKVGEEKDLPK